MSFEALGDNFILLKLLGMMQYFQAQFNLF
jgi:hypothetical protein